MAQYPCPVCKKECQNGTIMCSNCSNWVHASCTHLNVDDLKIWSNKNLTFTCKKCAFNNGLDYDAEAALNR